MKRTFFLMAVTLLALVLLGVGCAPAAAPTATPTPKAEAPTATPPPPEKVELVVIGRDYAVESVYTYAKEEMEKRHPNVTVTIQGLPYKEMKTQTLTSVAGGNPPDVVQVDNIFLGEYIKGGILMDLTDYVTQWPDYDDFVEAYRQVATLNGRVYGVWLNTDNRLFFWNKKLFQEAGLDPERPPRTWDELIEYGKKLTNPPEVYGFYFPASSQEDTPHRWYIFLYSAGGQILTDDGKQAAFNSEAGVKALELYKRLVDEGITPKTVLGDKPEDANKAFFAGAYAMLVGGSWGYRDAKKAGYDTPEKFNETFGAAPVPIPEGGQIATMGGGYVMGVPATTRHKDLALELLQIITSKELEQQYALDKSFVPVRKSILAQPDIFKDIFPYFPAIAEVAPYTHFRPTIPEYSEISTLITTAIQKAIAGEATPKEALDEAAAKVNELLAK